MQNKSLSLKKKQGKYMQRYSYFNVEKPFKHGDDNNLKLFEFYYFVFS